MEGFKVFRYGSDADEVTLISSAWCVTKGGLQLSFAVPIDVMDVDEICTFGKMFVDAVNESYGDMIKQYFISKSETPIVCSTDGGETLMMWTFSAEDTDEVRGALKGNGIHYIKY